jgi:hypothetical protein
MQNTEDGKRLFGNRTALLPQPSVRESVATHCRETIPVGPNIENSELD